MKITIEPTEDRHHGETIKNHAVCITHPDDELNLDEVVELLNAAVRAYGYNFANLIHEPENAEK